MSEKLTPEEELFGKLVSKHGTETRDLVKRRGELKFIRGQIIKKANSQVSGDDLQLLPHSKSLVRFSDPLVSDVRELSPEKELTLLPHVVTTSRENSASRTITNIVRFLSPRDSPAVSPTLSWDNYPETSPRPGNRTLFDLTLCTPPQLVLPPPIPLRLDFPQSPQQHGLPSPPPNDVPFLNYASPVRHEPQIIQPIVPYLPDLQIIQPIVPDLPDFPVIEQLIIDADDDYYDTSMATALIPPPFRGQYNEDSQSWIETACQCHRIGNRQIDILSASNEHPKREILCIGQEEGHPVMHMHKMEYL